MGCLKWIINFLLGVSVTFLILGKTTGIYGLEKVPSWIDGHYVEDIEKVVGAPVKSVFPYEESSLKIILEDSDQPVIISTADVPKPTRRVQFALLYTSAVQQGLLIFGGLFVISFIFSLGFKFMRLLF